MDKLVGLGRQQVSDSGATPDGSTILAEFVQKLASEQRDLPPEFAEVLNECFWDLL